MRNLRRRSAHRTAALSANPIEKVYYEMKPLLLASFAALGLSSAPSHTFFVKLNILVLLVLAAYLTYSRLVHRGYIKPK